MATRDSINTMVGEQIVVIRDALVSGNYGDAVNSTRLLATMIHVKSKELDEKESKEII